MIFACHFAVEICIAVHTTVFTCVIHTYINTLNAAANAPLIFIFPYLKLIITYPFKALFINAAGMFDI